jgi:hypothetical protein
VVLNLLDHLLLELKRYLLKSWDVNLSEHPHPGVCNMAKKPADEVAVEPVPAKAETVAVDNLSPKFNSTPKHNHNFDDAEAKKMLDMTGSWDPSHTSVYKGSKS